MRSDEQIFVRQKRGSDVTVCQSILATDAREAFKDDPDREQLIVFSIAFLEAFDDVKRPSAQAAKIPRVGIRQHGIARDRSLPTVKCRGPLGHHDNELIGHPLLTLVPDILLVFVWVSGREAPSNV